jgi:hypothetical protein
VLEIICNLPPPELHWFNTYKTAKRLQKIHKEMKKGENILIVKKSSINLENEIN